MPEIKMSVSKGKAVVILLNVAVFAITILFSQLSTRLNDIFPRTQNEISGTNQTEITPAASTFALWGFIYLYQAAWILYSLSLIWRGVDILPIWFYLAYSIGNLSSVAWLIVWARGQLSLAFAVLALLAISLDIALYFALTGLKRYLDQFPNNEKLPNKIDVWCVRMLMQNGVAFYLAWVSIATCLNLCIALQYDMNANGTKAASGVLSVLMLLIISWFLMENYFFEEYTRYVFVEYIVLIVGLSGIMKKHWKDGKGNQSFVLALLILSIISLIARICIIIWKESKNLNNGNNLRYIIRKKLFVDDMRPKTEGNTEA